MDPVTTIPMANTSWYDEYMIAEVDVDYTCWNSNRITDELIGAHLRHREKYINETKFETFLCQGGDISASR